MMTFIVETQKERLYLHINQSRHRSHGELVCSVDKTKCPVRAALIASEAVSLSLISPTIIISGSCLTNDLNPMEKVNPISGFT